MSTPNTWFAGKSAPEDRRGPDPFTMFGGFLLLYSPLACLVILGFYIAFNRYKLHWTAIGGFAALYLIPYSIGVALTGGIGARVRAFNAPLVDLFTVVRGKGDGETTVKEWLLSHIATWVFHQFFTSIAIGCLIGACWIWWKWLRRAEWEDNERVPGPFAVLRRRKTIDAIAHDTDGPADGLTVGYDTFGKRVVLTDAQSAAHTICAGGSGAGKTTTMMIGIRDAIRRGEPVCFVDMKGAVDVPAQLADWCQRYGRRFLHWTISDPRIGYAGPGDGGAFYDPISRGDPSRKKDLIIGAQKWDVEYYKQVAGGYLQVAFQVAQYVPNPDVDAFTDLAALLNPDDLSARCAALFHAAPKIAVVNDEWADPRSEAGAAALAAEWWKHTELVADPGVKDVLTAAAAICRGMEEQEKSAIRGLAHRITQMGRSTAGAWLRKDPEGLRDIDLRRAADEGWVVVFTLDSANYEETSKQIGGLIIQDLKTLSTDLRQNPAPTPFRIYVDEFSAIGSDNILGLLARARDARMPTMLSTQALADLKRADPAFLDQALGIVSCFLIHRANTEADSQVFAGLTGMKQTYTKRYNVEMTSGIPGGMSTGSATGQGMIEKTEDYAVTPSAFQALKPGELVFVAKAPENMVIHPVKVVRESEELSAVTAGTFQRSHTRPPAEDGSGAPEKAVTFTPVPLSQITIGDPAGGGKHARASKGAPVALPDFDLDLPVQPAETLPPAPGLPPDVGEAWGTPTGVRPDTTPGADDETLPPPPRREGPPLIAPEAFRTRGTLPAQPAPAGLPLGPPRVPPAPAAGEGGHKTAGQRPVDVPESMEPPAAPSPASPAPTVPVLPQISLEGTPAPATPAPVQQGDATSPFGATAVDEWGSGLDETV